MLTVRTRYRAFLAAFMPLIFAHLFNIGASKLRGLPAWEFWQTTRPTRSF